MTGSGVRPVEKGDGGRIVPEIADVELQRGLHMWAGRPDLWTEVAAVLME